MSDSELSDAKSDISISRAYDNVVVKGEKYTVGDWVHLRKDRGSQKPSVGQIFKVFGDGNPRYVEVRLFIRPSEVSTLSTRKFYSNELFQTSILKSFPCTVIQSKCNVLPVSLYSTSQTVDSEGRVIYVCESHYDNSTKTLTKIQNLDTIVPENIRTQYFASERLQRSTSKMSLAEAVLRVDVNGSQIPSPRSNQASGGSGRGRGRPPKKHGSLEPGKDSRGNSVGLSTNQFKFRPSRSAAVQARRKMNNDTGEERDYMELDVTEGGTQLRHNSSERKILVEEVIEGELLPNDIVRNFRTAVDGKSKGQLLWFAAPPVEALSPGNDPMPSLSYLVEMRKRAEKKRKVVATEESFQRRRTSTKVKPSSNKYSTEPKTHPGNPFLEPSDLLMSSKTALAQTTSAAAPITKEPFKYGLYGNVRSLNEEEKMKIVEKELYTLAQMINRGFSGQRASG